MSRLQMEHIQDRVFFNICIFFRMPIISMDCHEYEFKLKKKKEATERLVASNPTYINSEATMDTPPIEFDEELKFNERKSLRTNMTQPQTGGESSAEINRLL